MNRHRARRALKAATLVCATLGLVSCASGPEAGRARPADTPACRLFRPVSAEIGLGEPSVSAMTEGGCTAHKSEYGTLTLTVRDRPLASAASGDGHRTTMRFSGHDAVMLMGALNGVCKIFLDTGERTSVELRLGRTTAMTPQVCTSLKEAARKVAARLPASAAAAGS